MIDIELWVRLALDAHHQHIQHILTILYNKVRMENNTTMCITTPGHQRTPSLGPSQPSDAFLALFDWLFNRSFGQKSNLIKATNNETPKAKHANRLRASDEWPNSERGHEPIVLLEPSQILWLKSNELYTDHPWRLNQRVKYKIVYIQCLYTNRQSNGSIVVMIGKLSLSLWMGSHWLSSEWIMNFVGITQVMKQWNSQCKISDFWLSIILVLFTKLYSCRRNRP